eukprot:3732522-Rhodomonas_salina.2
MTLLSFWRLMGSVDSSRGRICSRTSLKQPPLRLACSISSSLVLRRSNTCRSALSAPHAVCAQSSPS